MLRVRRFVWPFVMLRSALLLNIVNQIKSNINDKLYPTACQAAGPFSARPYKGCRAWCAQANAHASVYPFSFPHSSPRQSAIRSRLARRRGVTGFRARCQGQVPGPPPQSPPRLGKPRQVVATKACSRHQSVGRITAVSRRRLWSREDLSCVDEPSMPPTPPAR